MMNRNVKLLTNYNLLSYTKSRMHSNCTAYVTGGGVFAVCESIQSHLGFFDQAALARFNGMTNNRYRAVEILSHRADFGQVYRIEYALDNYMPCS